MLIRGEEVDPTASELKLPLQRCDIPVVSIRAWSFVEKSA